MNAPYRSVPETRPTRLRGHWRTRLRRRIMLWWGRCWKEPHYRCDACGKLTAHIRLTQLDDLICGPCFIWPRPRREIGS